MQRFVGSWLNKKSSVTVICSNPWLTNYPQPPLGNTHDGMKCVLLLLMKLAFYDTVYPNNN